MLGGNLGALYLLQSTEYQPLFHKPFIFALEDDDEAGEYTTREVSRRFKFLLLLLNFRKNIKGLIIGRSQPYSILSQSDIESIVNSKQLGDTPIISGVDFGHSLPMVTLSIGGNIKIFSVYDKSNIEIYEA